MFFPFLLYLPSSSRFSLFANGFFVIGFISTADAIYWENVFFPTFHLHYYPRQFWYFYFIYFAFIISLSMIAAIGTFSRLWLHFWKHSKQHFFCIPRIYFQFRYFFSKAKHFCLSKNYINALNQWAIGPFSLVNQGFCLFV